MAPSNSTRKRQTRLAFTPLPSSSPAAKGYHKQIQDRAAAVSLEPSPRRSKCRKLNDDDVVQLDGGADVMPTPAASAPRRRGEIADTSESEDDEPIRSTQRRTSAQKKTAKSRPKQGRLDWSNVRDADTFSSPVRVSSPSRPQSSAAVGMFGGTQRPRLAVDISSDESEDLPSPGTLVKNSKKKAKAGQTRSSGRATRSTQPITVDSESEGENIVVSSERKNEIETDNEDEDDDMPTTLGTQRRKRAARRNSFISSSPPAAVESDDDLEIIEKPKKRARRKEDSDDEEESDLETPRRRLKKSKKATQREKDDLAEDLDFLGPSSDVDESRQPRDTQTSAKNARQFALEKLKRRRSGVKAEPEAEQQEIQEELDDLNDDDVEEVEPEYAYQKPRNRKEMFDEDEYDDGFIEEDDGDLGVPDDLPIEFTRYASMKPKELFKHAVEWFVQKKINPAFSLNDPLYDLAFRKLDDEVKGLAGSKYMSAAWTEDFTKALKSRPHFASSKLLQQDWLQDRCDACNRSGHPATFEIQFQGKPYNPKTLEEVGRYDEGEEDDSDSASSNNEDNHEADDQPAYDHTGNQIAPANKTYYVGKFCMANAETAHILQHWRFHINEWIVDWLNKEGYLTPDRIVRRDGKSTAKRRKEAEKITDRMEQEGVVKELWKTFCEQVRQAREGKGGSGRDVSP